MHITKLSLSTLALASTLLLGSVAEAAPCTVTEQSQFFATFGDVTQTYDGAGSVDDATASLYGIPTSWLTSIEDDFQNGNVGTDVLMADANRPIVLQGYEPFAATEVDWAIVRFDLYFTHYSNTEGLWFMTDPSLELLTNFAYYDRLRAALIDAGEDRAQWISIRLDLITGAAFASEIDAFGNPIADYGQFATFGDDPNDGGLLEDVLAEASDGDLYALFYDDMGLSYAALYGSESITYTNIYCGPSES